jgi:cob(I)alamin adenosyltransferase
MDKPMLQVYCGDGKGKTTAAVGLAVRAAGAGLHVFFTQFMKGDESSELRVLRTVPGIEIMKPEKHYGFFL